MGCCCSNAVSNADDPSAGGDGGADGENGKRGGIGGGKDGPTSFKVMSIKASGKSGSGTAVSELASPRTQWSIVLQIIHTAKRLPHTMQSVTSLAVTSH